MSPLAEDQKLEVWKMIQDFHDSKVLPLHVENIDKMDKLTARMNVAAGAAGLAIILIPIIVVIIEKVFK